MNNPVATVMTKQIMYQRAMHEFSELTNPDSRNGEYQLGFEEAQSIAAEMLTARAEYLNVCAETRICTRIDCVQKAMHTKPECFHHASHQI